MGDDGKIADILHQFVLSKYLSNCQCNPDESNAQADQKKIPPITAVIRKERILADFDGISCYSVELQCINLDFPLAPYCGHSIG